MRFKLHLTLLFLVVHSAFTNAQSTIKGALHSEGEPHIGVNIIEKNTTNGTTSVTLTNSVAIETVSQLLGHSRISTTQIYAKFIERKISENINSLKQRLSKISKINIS
jgi:hypothetical protein